MEPVLFGAWCFAVALAGGLVGLVLGNLRLPATLLAASGAAAGAGTNLVISAIAAATAATVHLRVGRVNYRLLAVMAPPSILRAEGGGLMPTLLRWVGSRLMGRLSDVHLLRAIAAVLFVTAVGCTVQAVA